MCSEAIGQLGALHVREAYQEAEAMIEDVTSQTRQEYQEQVHAR